MITPIRTNAFLPLLVVAAFTFYGCQKGTVNPGGGGGGDLMIEYSWNGTTHSLDDPNGHFTLSTGSSPWNFFSGFMWDEGAFQVGFGSIEDEVVTAAEFTALFSPGNVNYQQDLPIDMGVSIVYENSQENFWTSFCGAQTGSTFVITSMESISGPVQQVKVSGTFNATLYDCSGVQVPMTITNGTFTLIFENS